MRPAERDFLNSEHGKKITWKNDHEWEKTSQLNLIEGNQAIMTSIKNCSDHFASLTVDELIQMFLNVGCIVADECTLEIYQLLA